MPAVQERFPTAYDFEDVALYDPKATKASRKTSESSTMSEHTLRGSQGSPNSTSSQRSSPDSAGNSILHGSAMDPHSSFQSIGSNVSTPTLASDTSSFRSSLSSISSPTLVLTPNLGPGKPPHIEELPPMPPYPGQMSQGRRKSVPTLVDNTSMASLTNLPSFRTQHRTYSARTRKQREMDFDSDKGEDIWPDGLMFNVPMSPALYAQQKHQQHQYQHAPHAPHQQSAPMGPPRNMGRGTSPSGRRKGSVQTLNSKTKALPSIHEQQPEFRTRLSAEKHISTKLQDFNLSDSMSRTSSILSGDFVRNPYNESIDGLDHDASDLTIEMYRLEEEELEKRHRLGSNSALSDSSRDSDMLPMPKRSSEGEASSGDSRRSSLTRPENLPPKTPEEERKHLEEYEKLMKDAIAAEKRKQRKKEEEAKQRAQQEKSDAAVWSSWLAKKSKARLSSDLKWRGIPSRVRGSVWLAQTGADVTNLPPPSSSARDEIVRDSEYVWPECGIFGPDRPLHESLIRVVQTFLAARPGIQYQVSLACIAGLLLLQLDEREAAATMVELVSPGSLAHSVLTNNEQLASANYVSFDKIYRSKFERLSQHFTKVGITISEFMNPLVEGLFSTVLPTPELASRIIDVYIFEGDSFLLRAGLGLLRTNEAWLYCSKEETLEHLEDPRVSSDDNLMQAIRNVTKL